MDSKQFKEYLIKHFNISEEQFELFIKYKNFLQTYNQTTNLTRLDDESIVYDAYFIESIEPFKYIKFADNTSLLDIGSGSGIPGVALKILYPNLEVCLIDANNKKVNFLKQLVAHLSLTNIKIIHGRCEEVIRTDDLYEHFDYVTSRAVSSLHNILELSAGFCKVNGLIIEPKSQKNEVEYQNALNVIKQQNLVLVNKLEYELSNKNHVVFVFTKTSPTNKKYPRSWAQIIKDENFNHHK